jgi:ABC-type nickel/cobalt efflux system permease component RcnA
MGNFSISHFAGIEIGADSVRVKYLLDFAEVPAVRELEQADPDLDDLVTPEERAAYLAAKTDEILPQLTLEVNGENVPLASEWSRVSFPPGEGGLSTVRVAWMLCAPIASDGPDRGFLTWNDAAYEDRDGWKEIRFAGTDGVGIGKTSLRWSPQSDELSEYPEEYLWNPPRDTKGWCLFGPGMQPDAADDADFQPPDGFGGEPEGDRFARLMSAPVDGPLVLAAALLLAAVLGAGHALEPGHGKTLVAAYLVGQRGTVSQAALLGLTVTFTHTFSVFLLGVVVLFLSRHVVPERLFPWLGFLSGALIAAVGISMLRARLREVHGGSARGHSHPHHHAHAHDPVHAHDHARPPDPALSHDHDHDHGHGHGPAHDHSHGPHGHSHAPPDGARLRDILALGVSGGLVPCPAGIVVLLAAVASGRIAFGLALIVAFSVGLGAVLVGIAVLFVTARRLLDRLPLGGSWIPRLGLVSAAVVTAFGVALAYRAIA